MIHKWTLVTQLGLTLNKRDLKGNWYARIAFRRDLWDNFFFRAGLKVPEGFVADFIEVGCGVYLYKFAKKK